MAGYDSTKLHQIVAGGIGGGAPAIWTHESTDAAALVQVSGYITDGGSRGMKVGDLVLHTDNDASPPLTSTLKVVTVSATYPGAVDLANTVALSGATNTD
jgi:hypothetical protein